MPNGLLLHKKTVLGNSKRSEFGRKSEEDKVGHFVGLYSGYFFLQSIGMLPWKKSVLSFSWNVFDFEDDSKKFGLR